METNKICKYCKLELEVSVSADGLDCKVCSESIHVKCLARGTVPGGLNGDVFYTFTCKECSPTNEEVFFRDRLSWLRVIILTLYNLRTRNMYSSSRGGNYYQVNQIVSFIEDHWDILFGKHTIKKIKIPDLVNGTLTQFNKTVFLSRLSTWWALKYTLTPRAILSLTSICRNVKTEIGEKRDPLVDRAMFENVMQENIRYECASPKEVEESSAISEHELRSTEAISSSPNLLKSSTIEDNSSAAPSTSYKPFSDSASASKPAATISERKRRNSEMMTSSPLKLFKPPSNKDDLLDNPSASASKSSTVPKRKLRSTKTSSSPKLSDSCSVEGDSFSGPSTSYKALSDPACASKSSTVAKRKLRSTKTTSSSPKLSDSCSVEGDSFSGPSTSYKALSDPASASKSSTVAKRKLRSTKTTSSSPKLSDSCNVECDSFSGPSTSYNPLSDPASASKSATVSERKRRNTGMMSSSSSKLFKSYSNKDKPLSRSTGAARTIPITEHELRRTEMMSSSPKLSRSVEDDSFSVPSTSSASESSTVPKRKLTNTKTTSSSRKSLDFRSVEGGSFSGPSTSYKPLSEPASASKSATVAKRKLRTTKTTSSSPKLSDSCSVEGDSCSGPSTSYKRLSDPASAPKLLKSSSSSSTNYNPLSHPASTSKSSTVTKRKLRTTKTMSSSPKLLKSDSVKADSFGGPSTSYYPLPHPASASSTVAKRILKSTETTSKSRKLLDSYGKDHSLSVPSTRCNPLSHPASTSNPSTISKQLKINTTPNASASPSLYRSTASSPSLSSPAQLIYRLYHFNTCMTSVSKVRHIQLGERLIDGDERGLIQSPYSGIFLNPYIWQDVETFPPWLQMMCQVQLKSNQQIEDYIVPPRAPIDYAYVQPEHILAVNTLCNQYLCSGIDLTESLQHPEFSCVVLYKRLIVAFAFIIPNVSDSEHYLSYIFTRPGWRRVGIAKHMLYFLLKNSAGKDVTLHVSFDNVACCLYQKFGFKVERIEKNFYENYVRMKKDESTDALFCRRKGSLSGDV